jgi:plastocyanin domain-containing protein
MNDRNFTKDPPRIRKNNRLTCATEIKIKEKKINTKLPLNKEVSVDVGVLSKGDIKFACGMDMITGHIIVE